MRKRVHSRSVRMEGGRLAGKIPQARNATMSISWELMELGGVVCDLLAGKKPSQGRRRCGLEPVAEIGPSFVPAVRRRSGRQSFGGQGRWHPRPAPG